MVRLDRFQIVDATGDVTLVIIGDHRGIQRIETPDGNGWTGKLTRAQQANAEDLLYELAINDEHLEQSDPEWFLAPEVLRRTREAQSNAESARARARRKG